MRDVRWLAEYAEGGETWFRIGRSEREFVAEWIGVALLVATRDGSHTFSAEPDAGPWNVEKIRRGAVRLLLHHLQGKLALHGACVGLDGRAVILLGRSGQGKSTLAASLCERGAALFADDAVAIERTMQGSRHDVLPGEVNHWLAPSAMRALGHEPSTEGKSILPSAKVSTSRASLVGIVDLAFVDDAETPRLVRVDEAVSSMASLVPQVVRFILDDPDVQRHELEMLGELVARVPMYRLERRRELALLPEAGSCVFDLLCKGNEKKV